MTAFGAEVIIVDQAEGAIDGQVSGEDLALVEAEAASIVARRDAFRVDQFRREANVLAHERHTGPELWEQSQGKIDVFVDMVGTGGSFTGVTRALRRFNPRLRAYVVEPAGAAVLGGGAVTNPRHRIQGAGYARADLALFDRSLATGYVSVSDEQAIAAARHLAAEEGIFAGFSTGRAPGRGLEAARRRRAGRHNRVSRLRQRAEVPEHGSFSLSWGDCEGARMKSYTEHLTFNIPARMDFLNITPQVEEIVRKSDVQEGLVLVNAMHITASVFINDDESGLHEDYKKWLEGWPRSTRRQRGTSTTAPAKTTPTPT